jgi:Dyp-type peroxidase family
MDLCFELATQIMARIGDAVSQVDEVHGFRYFDDHDLIGFVDDTENPRGDAAMEAVLIGEEDAAFAGGSYVIVQKYLHDLDGWNALPTEAQERIIGRTKLSDMELDDSVKPTSAHNALTRSLRTEKRSRSCATTCPSAGLGLLRFRSSLQKNERRKPLAWFSCSMLGTPNPRASLPMGVPAMGTHAVC